MKYEIIKGSEKDFEGAPSWATHVVNEGNYDAFSEGFDYMSRARWTTSKGNEFRIGNPGLFSIIAERRPITEPVVNHQLTTEWDGTGLPPVGVRCEHLGGGENDWMTVTVIAISERPDSPFTDYWLRTENGANFIIGNPYRFRPIRSPEDVAREVATNAFNDIGVMNLIHARQIYDAIAAGKIPGVKLEK